MAAEFVGTAMLLIAIVGSGIGIQRLLPESAAMHLLANAIATGLGLAAAIFLVGAVSGAQLNPVITLVDRALGGLGTGDTGGYIVAQAAGACTGVVLANVMFSLSAVDVSTTVRSGAGVWLGEVVATFGLVVLVFSLVHSGLAVVAPFAIGAYVTAAILATSSTAFANPAVTIGRMFSNTFTGIAPVSVPAFLLAQVLGGALAFAAVRLFFPSSQGAEVKEAVVRRDSVE